MSPPGDTYTPRQYKPTYTYNPHQPLPLANRLPSMSTSKPTHSPHTTHSLTPVTTLSRPSRRRRTTSNLPNLDPQHSLPTVASSVVTACASTTARRIPSCNRQKPPGPPLSYSETTPSIIPSRIPTPLWRRGSCDSAKENTDIGRNFSSPVVLSSGCSSQKEVCLFSLLPLPTTYLIRAGKHLEVLLIRT